MPLAKIKYKYVQLHLFSTFVLIVGSVTDKRELVTIKSVDLFWYSQHYEIFVPHDCFSRTRHDYASTVRINFKLTILHAAV